jgi:hypothetical protein
MYTQGVPALADNQYERLDELIRLEDALDFIQEGMSKAQHLACFKPELQDVNARSWDKAIEMIATLGSLKKASDVVRREIETYR